MKAFRILAFAFFLSLVLGFNQTPIAAAQGRCIDIYTVLPGDTLTGIAEYCGTTVQAILDANPEVSDPTLIYVGQKLIIPTEGRIEPILAISPTCGPPATEIFVVVSGFPSNTTVEIGINRENYDLKVIGTIVTDSYGGFKTSMIIPSSALPNNLWTVTARRIVKETTYKAVSAPFTVIPHPIDPNASFFYTVQPGDTLRNIAVKFDRSIDAILEANPQITNPNKIFPGQIITLPPQESGEVSVSLSPTCGIANTFATISGSGFPIDQQVRIAIGKYQEDTVTAVMARVDSQQKFSFQITIPNKARPGERWVAQAETTVSPMTKATSNFFFVTKPIDPHYPKIYVVKQGDTFNSISADFRRSTEMILAANPEIANRNELEIGQTIIIPGQEKSLFVTPLSGPPGSEVSILGVGFFPNTQFQIGIGRQVSKFTLHQTVKSDSNGEFKTKDVIPSHSRPGDRWLMVAVQTIGRENKVAAVSQEFFVTGLKPRQPSVVTIWPLSGPPTTILYISAAGFPPYSQVNMHLGPQGSVGELILNTWTDINGTIAAETTIPDNAIPGETWIISVQTISDVPLEATSSPFTVTEE